MSLGSCFVHIVFPHGLSKIPIDWKDVQPNTHRLGYAATQTASILQ